MIGASDAAVIGASHVVPERFGVIFHRHFDSIHAYLSRRVGRDVADELAGEVFVTAFEIRRRFDAGRESARPWLFGIAANVMRRRFRDDQRRAAAYRRVMASDVDPKGDDSEDHVSRLAARQLVEGLAAAIAALADADREVLLLYTWEELTYAEIAEALDVPVGTVASRMHRVRTQLRVASKDDGRRASQDGETVLETRAIPGLQIPSS